MFCSSVLAFACQIVSVLCSVFVVYLNVWLSGSVGAACFSFTQSSGLLCNYLPHKDTAGADRLHSWLGESAQTAVSNGEPPWKKPILAVFMACVQLLSDAIVRFIHRPRTTLVLLCASQVSAGDYSIVVVLIWLHCVIFSLILSSPVAFYHIGQCMLYDPACTVLLHAWLWVIRE